MKNIASTIDAKKSVIRRRYSVYI